MDLYKKFNTSLKLFIRDLMSVYPDVGEFKKIIMIYKMLKTINKKFPYKIFHNAIVEKHRQNVLDHDESFFSIQIFDDPDIPPHVRILISQLTPIYKVWADMTEDNKNAVWDHLNLLIKICDQIQEQC